MGYYIESTVFLFSFFLAFLFGIYRFRSFDKSTQIFACIAITSFVGEVIALYAAVMYRNNLGVYNIILLVTVPANCLYFNNSIAIFKRNKLGLYLAALSILFWFVTVFYIHPLKSLNTTFMFYEGILTICLSIFSIDQLLKEKSKVHFSLRNNIHFWIAWLLFAYWCVAGLQWILYDYYTQQIEEYSWINLSLTACSVFINIGFALVFFLYPKMQKKNALR